MYEVSWFKVEPLNLLKKRFKNKLHTKWFSSSQFINNKDGVNYH